MLNFRIISHDVFVLMQYFVTCMILVYLLITFCFCLQCELIYGEKLGKFLVHVCDRVC